MTLHDWVTESVDRVQTHGYTGLRESGYELYIGALRRIGRLYDPGESVYSREWDVLLVLDACRYDLMTEVAGEYDFINEVEPFTSTASSSREWMTKNFRYEYADEMRQTAHITGNPFSDQCLRSTDFARLDEVWRYAWDDELGTIPPRPITDRAVEAWRAGVGKRMIVHYMQPHYPFIPHPELHQGMVVANFGDAQEPFWKRVRRGEIDREIAWNAYRENLLYVLDEVGFLLSVIDADSVVISADHGNAVGRLGVYGHPGGVPLAILRRVPWIDTSATGHREYEPETMRDESLIDSSTTSKLRDLGYI